MSINENQFSKTFYSPKFNYTPRSTQTPKSENMNFKFVVKRKKKDENTCNSPQNKVEDFQSPKNSQRFRANSSFDNNSKYQTALNSTMQEFENQTSINTQNNEKSKPTHLLIPGGMNQNSVEDRVFNIMHLFKKNIDVIKSQETSLSERKISKNDAVFASFDKSVLTVTSIQQMDEIVQEYERLRQSRQELSKNYHQRKKREKEEMKQQGDIQKIKTSSGSENIPQIDSNSHRLFTKSVKLNKNTFERLYTYKGKREIENADNPQETKYPYKPTISEYSNEILKSNGKQDDYLSKTHYEKLQNDYKKKYENLSKLIRTFEENYSQKPHCNNNSNIEWNWDKFQEDNKKLMKARKDKARNVRDSSEESFDQDSIPEMDENSVRIMQDKGKFQEFEKKMEIDIFRFQDRIRLQNHYNDFQHRLQDEFELFQKYESLDIRREEYYTERILNKPKIDDQSDAISLNRVTDLEKKKIYNRRWERRKWEAAKEKSESKDARDIYQRQIKKPIKQ